ncbi:MAG: 23S rRNA (pseudouridine(1915)-N(3))-methyltransferase RlmH, partial [Pseudomonadota bacterium]|nr:23S rRNA (pseudouridine(1915)-N(3))-methyltransferase RlmH [Pseudomonadota bacterium]
MKLILVAVGLRLPAWAEAGYAEYAKRFPPELRLELKPVKAEPRAGRTTAQLRAAEAARIEAALPRGARRVLLDERGEPFGTAALAARIGAWQADGRDVGLVIGGADGIDPALQASAVET